MTSQINAQESRPVTDREFFLVLMDGYDKRYQQRFEAQERALESALSSAKEAVDKAQVAAEKRFDSVNEFRNTLADQQRNLLPRQEYQVQHKALEEVVKAVSDRVDIVAQRQYIANGQSEAAAKLWGFIIGSLGIVIAIASVWINFKSKQGS